MWAEWLRNNKIKDGIFWCLDEKKQTSWTWKTILNLRPIARNFLRSSLGNGLQLSFWFDWWTPLGPLIDFLGTSGPAQTGISLQAKVANACSSVGWNLRPARSSHAESLQIYLTTVSPPSLASDLDSFSWLIGSEELENFSTKKTWEALRQRSDPLPWTDQVWYKGAIPRHAFMMWLMHLDRLPTRARLASWGLQIDTSCCLCGLFLETRDHLFLHCEVSEGLWLEINKRLGYNSFTFHTWDALSAWLDVRDSRSPRCLRRLVAQATLYEIWRERNNRYHNNISTDVRILFKRLDRQIRDAILAKKKYKDFNGLMQIWLKHD